MSKNEINIANHYMCEDEDIEVESSGIDFEEEFVKVGHANEKGITEEDVDPKELAMGIEIEMEHTTNKEVSKRISLDHLVEIPDYYTRLKKMEEDAMGDQEESTEEE